MAKLVADDPDFAAAGVEPQPGYLGVFTRRNALGAIPAGTRIIKVAGLASDACPVGDRGTVLGSCAHSLLGRLYFVEWDGRLAVAVAVKAFKIRPL